MTHDMNPKKSPKVKWVWLIVLLVLLVLMLIPVHVYMKDGGSEAWDAVLWQVEKLHRIKDGNGEYLVGTRVTLLPFGLITVYDDTVTVYEDESGVNNADSNKEKPLTEAEKNRLIETLLGLSKKEIQITCRKPEEPLDPLASRLGGSPALPEGFEWPCYTGIAYEDTEPKTRPLSFLGQINLKELAGLDEEQMLPEGGVLSFFYDLETMTWGFDPEDRGSARVFYFPDETALRPAELPEALAEAHRLPELAVELQQRLSLPDYEDFPDIECSWEDFEACRESCGVIRDESDEGTKLLGYPDVIQNPMEPECEALSRGYRQGSPADYAQISEGEMADIQEKSRDWVLLFQMGTVRDGDYVLEFGDAGHIYFWIRKSDLADRRFENAWLILQCY